MVLLFEKFTTHTHKPSSKFKKRHSASLSSFEADILNCLQLQLSTPGSEPYSLSWVQTCLLLLPSIEGSFAKFVAEVDYPVTEWKSCLVDEYLKGSLSLLDHFNCISSSVNHLSQTCMELLYALSLAEASPTLMSNELKEILPQLSKKVSETEGGEERVLSEKGLIVYKALLVRKRVINWLCRIISSSINGGEVVLECNGVCEVIKEEGVLLEVGEINQGTVQVLASAKKGLCVVEEAKELRCKVEEFRKLLGEVKEDVNRLFSEAMIRRNELLSSFQNRKQ